MATFIMAKKLIAIFSNRVPMRRHSFSQPMLGSTMLRRLYMSLSNFTFDGGPPRCPCA